MRKKIIPILMLAFTFTTMCSESVLAFPQCTYLNNTDNSEGTCEPRANKIDYVYKVVDGVLYKRLYNFTTQEYIGNWIKA